MAGNASNRDFPVGIRKLAANYLTLTSQRGIAEASRVGSEGSEFSEGTEGSETSERSETTETSETTERKETIERTWPTSTR
ncbi:hypothetical protein [Amycolatopsis pigmentata]|uniref:Uncharacterized protein n=1 Tax=Amycolatopsis pigmentata TaxID=450801 RepID=A0ABW5FNS7_9PSEU